jgi:predicted MFS family arabinose efflux permease
MSLLFATVYAGWLFGPLAGGYLMMLGVEWVFTIAAAATFLTMIVVAIGIKTRESRPDEERSLIRIVVEENSFALLKHRVIWPLFSFYLIYTFAINLFYEFYPVWLVERFEYDSQEIAWMTVVITTFMIMSSVFLATKLIQWFGQFLTLVIGVFVLPLLILLLTTSSENAVFVLYALIGTTIAIINAVTPTYMSDRFESFGQGKIMGLQTSLFFLANVVMAIIGALIAMMSVDATMIAASVIMFLSLVWFFVTGESSQLKSQYAQTK